VEFVASGVRGRRRRVHRHVRVEFRRTDFRKHLFDLLLYRILVVVVPVFGIGGITVIEIAAARTTVIVVVVVGLQRLGLAADAVVERPLGVARHGSGRLEHAVYSFLRRY